MPTATRFIQGCAMEWGKIAQGIYGWNRVRLEVAQHFRLPASVRVEVDHRSDLYCGDAKVWADRAGLYFEMRVQNAESVRSVRDIERGILKGCSVSLLTRGEFKEDANFTFYDASEIVSVVECSMCETPANPAAWVRVSDASIAPKDCHTLRNDWLQSRLTQSRRLKAPKLIQIPPISNAALNAMERGAIFMRAASRGEGVWLGNRQISAALVKQLMTQPGACFL